MTTIKIDTETIIISLKSDDVVDEEKICIYLTDILNEAGIEAEGIYQDCDWYIKIKDKKYFIALACYDEQEKQILSAIRFFSDELNSGNDYNCSYSHIRKEKFLNIWEKEQTEKKAETEG